MIGAHNVLVKNGRNLSILALLKQPPEGCSVEE